MAYVVDTVVLRFPSINVPDWIVFSSFPSATLELLGGSREASKQGIVALTDFESTTQTTTLYVAGSDKMLKEASVRGIGFIGSWFARVPRFQASHRFENFLP